MKQRNTVSYRETVEVLHKGADNLEDWMNMIEELGMEDTEPENVREMQLALDDSIFQCGRFQSFLEKRR